MAVSYLEQASAKLGLSPVVVTALKDFLWMIIAENADQTISLGFWVIRKKFKLRDLYPAFELVLGPPPAAT